MADNTGRGTEPSSSGIDAESRVIYIGQLPHGFYEEQLKGVLRRRRQEVFTTRPVLDSLPGTPALLCRFTTGCNACRFL